MAYNFGSVTTDKIDCGAIPQPTSGSFSLSVRVRPKAANTSRRYWTVYANAAGTTFLWYLGFTGSGTNRIEFGFKDGVAGFPNATWTSGFGANEEHLVIAVFDDAANTLSIYADGDAAAKVTTSSVTTNLAAGTATMVIGNNPAATTESADADICDMCYWYGRALSVADRMALYDGTPPPDLVCPPTRYWPLRDSPAAEIGGFYGSVTGAKRVAMPRELPDDDWNDAAPSLVQSASSLVPQLRRSMRRLIARR